MTQAGERPVAEPVRLELSEIRAVRDGGERHFLIPAAFEGLEGRTVEANGTDMRLVRPTARAAARLRTLVPALRPRSLGVRRSSFGFGDRTGQATPGHVAALRATGSAIDPVLAQQSARELERTGRSFREVLDATTWGLVECGWTGLYGADADHLTSAAHVRNALRAGFTMVTLDPSAHIDPRAAVTSGSSLEELVEALPWQHLEDDWHSMRRRHEQRAGADGGTVSTARAAAVYGRALTHVAGLARTIDGSSPISVDVEISVDETAHPTSPFEHAFLAEELHRLGVRFTSLAPRFPGTWEKGVDVTGDVAALRTSIAQHLRVADRGYKLSVHSGSDKPTVYGLLAASDDGPWHVKTSGTSYLEALRVIAMVEPNLFRDVLALARRAHDDDRRSYAISPTAAIPTGRVADAALPSLLDDQDVRQSLHVTYGTVLADRELGARLLETLDGAREAYTNALSHHLGEHLRLLGGLA